MTKFNKRVAFRLDREDWEEFSRRTKKHNLTRSQVLRQFIKKFNEGVYTISDLYKEE